VLICIEDSEQMFDSTGLFQIWYLAKGKIKSESTTPDETREFEFILQFESGADELMDVFRQTESHSLWSSSIFASNDNAWRLYHAKGTSNTPKSRVNAEVE
jgi:hypothetical protein